MKVLGGRTIGAQPVSLRRQVRDLRERGMSVKEIARTIGEKASDIAPLVNAIAAEDLPQETDPGVVGLLGQSGLEHRPHRARSPRVARQRRHCRLPGGIAAVLSLAGTAPTACPCAATSSTATASASRTRSGPG